MRDHHPDSRDPERITDFLDSSKKNWRKACSELFGCDDLATFGGNFREQIYCSSLPACCWDELQLIFRAYESKTLLSNSLLKEIRPGLFRDFVGVKEEPRVHRLLSQLSCGLVTVEEFRKNAKKLKEQKTRSSDDVVEENARLKRENLRLKEEINDLKRKLNEKDVFEFIEDPEENTRPQRVILPKRLRTLENPEDQLEQIFDQIRDIENDADMTDENENEESSDTNVTCKNQTMFSVGEKVEAKWKDGSWYEAIILKTNEKSARIKFTMDNVECRVVNGNIRKK